MTRARRVELHLEEGGEPHVREALRPPRYAHAPEKRLALALRHADTKLATLRVIDPVDLRVGALRSYLEVAVGALATALRLRDANRGVERHQALVGSLSDTCLLNVDAQGCVAQLRGGTEALRRRWSALVELPLAEAAERGTLGLSRSDLNATLQRARRTGRAEARTTLRASVGESDVHLVFVPAGDAGELLCTVRDLSEVKAIEKALLRRNQELSVAAERLKEVDMLKNEFMSNVSHELRTPLTAIIAYAEALLLTTPDAKTRDEFLRVICEQGHKLQKLIGGLLDIAKLDSLATELKLQLGSLNDVIESAVVTVRPTADKSQIDIVLELEPDLPPVYLDELRSQQIVWNLLTNAIKFSPARSQIAVRSWSRDGKVWASVADRGPGIAREYQELIFEKFVQVDGSSTRRHGGVGLGLDLVKHLVELHGGDLQLESTVGHGSTFTFGIPIEKRLKPRVGPKSKPLSRTREPS